LQVIGEALDGLEAVQMAEELKPDLILLDIGLPNLNGIEAARLIRSVSPNSKIIFVSQESSADIVQQVLSLGACGYVVKTDAKKEILAAVTAVLRGELFVGSRFAAHNFSGDSDREPSGAGDLENFENKTVFAPIPQNEGQTCQHEAGFYPDDTCFLDHLTEFIAAAIKAGDAAIVVATKSHRDSILPELRAQGLHIGAAIEEGRYIALDAADTLSALMVNGMVDSVRFFKLFGDLIVTAADAAKGEHTRVSIFAECAPLLWARGEVEAAIQLEKLANRLAEMYDVNILCGYCLGDVHGGIDTQIFQRISAEHSSVHSW
jgi:CheY-like chemotaxis protein